VEVVETRLGCLHCFVSSADGTAEGLAMLSPQNTEFDIQHIETKFKRMETGYVEGSFSNDTYERILCVPEI
jgi:hypothetical protein